MNMACGVLRFAGVKFPLGRYVFIPDNQLLHMFFCMLDVLSSLAHSCKSIWPQTIGWGFQHVLLPFCAGQLVCVYIYIFYNKQ